ncbi:hypothetical protein [Staphylococcus phage vB_SauM-V1SA22]|nr:hypothetical protein [Staphylococcus phage vB_SauM-V1SA22]
MKIKTKKEMPLDELIKWARENPELSQGKKYCTTGESYEAVCFQKDTNKCFTLGGFISIDTLFEVKVEEEITEDTKFDRLFEVYEFRERAYMSAMHTNTSIKERLENTSFPTKAFYILNDDLTMTLIWKDGELIV